jgi:hypothetical protein
MGAHAHPWAAGLHRRRTAAAQSVPLDCGCRDPWTCDCTENLFDRDGFDRWVDAGGAAARHLLEVGCTPILETDVLQALWRRGGPERALAQHLFALAGG